MAKVINIKPQDEITSIIERLWETAEEEVFLVASTESAFLKNIIAMKLLKREADRLGKEVVLITKDSLGREMAKRVGLLSRIALPKKIKEEEQEVFHEVAPEEFESLIEDEVRVKRGGLSVKRQFSDIRPKDLSVKKREEFEEEPLLADEDSSAEELVAPFEDLIPEGSDINNKDFPDSDFFTAKRPERQTEDEFSEDLKEEIADISDESEEGNDEEDFPIHGTVKGGRRLAVNEKKSLFSRWPFFKLKKISHVIELDKIKSERSRQRSTTAFFSGKFLGLFIGLTLVIALLVLYFILPKAEITVVPRTEAVTQDLTITADKGITKIDFTLNKIPAQLIKLDQRQSQEFAVTGERQVNDRAKGKIVIYNKYSSSPQVLVAKTRFVSESGKTFRLIKSITVPGAQIDEGKVVASSIEAEVAADSVGADYNIGPSRFNIPGFQGTPKYAAFYGQSNSSMSGGASGLMRIVAQDDYDKARNQLWQNLLSSLDSEFKNQAPQGLKIIDGAQKKEISGVETSAAVGSPAEKFTMTVKGVATAVLFDEKDVLEIINKKIIEKLNNGQNPFLVADQISYQLILVDYNRGQVSAKVKLTGKLVWEINKDSLKKEVIGQNEKAIIEIFARHTEVNEAKVVFWPFWVTKVPNSVDKVAIKIRQ